jgi:hypothetical protein
MRKMAPPIIAVFFKSASSINALFSKPQASRPNPGRVAENPKSKIQTLKSSLC